MPEKLDKCVQKLMSEGKSKSSAFAICNAQLKLGKKPLNWMIHWKKQSRK